MYEEDWDTISVSAGGGKTCLADTVSLNATYNQNPALLENVGIGDPPFINPGTYQAGVYNFKINAYNSGSPTSTPLTLCKSRRRSVALAACFREFASTSRTG